MCVEGQSQIAPPLQEPRLLMGGQQPVSPTAVAPGERGQRVEGAVVPIQGAGKTPLVFKPTGLGAQGSVVLGSQGEGPSGALGSLSPE